MSDPDDRSRPKLPPTPGVPSADAKDDATTFAVLPRFKEAALLPKTEGKLLTALKAQISQLKIEVAGSGIRHEHKKYLVLPRTLRSAWLARVNHAQIGALKLLMGQTRSAWILVCDEPPEKIYEDPRFMGLELKKRDVTMTPKGKRMYVSLIGRKELDRINAIAAQDAGAPTGHPSLAPVEGAFDLKDTLERLRRCELLGCTDRSFDLTEFVSQIHFMTPTQASASYYYYVEAGFADDPVTCELHVGEDPALPAGSFSDKATLSFGGERSYLYLNVTL